MLSWLHQRTSIKLGSITSFRKKEMYTLPINTTGGPWKPKGNKGGTNSIEQSWTQTLSNCIRYSMLAWEELSFGQTRSSWELPVGRFIFGLYIIISNKSTTTPKEAESPREGITVNRYGPEGQ